MISSDVLVYTNEILNFLQTVTVRYNPFALSINNQLKNKGFVVDDDDKRTWKYYLNAYGVYHESDTPMTIVSLDTNEVVLYSKEILAKHPKTKAAYIIGRNEYNNLCNEYPNQTDLIKSIAYPVFDFDEFIMDDDLTLHGYGSGFLEPAEEDILITDYVQFLSYVRDRWFLEAMGYEPLYFVSFWTIFLDMSVVFLLSTRLTYLQTEHAHSLHIWEYLRSKGLSDYRDILSSSKAAFLYKNIVYLQGNSGKISNINILIEHLLGDLSVGMVGETIYQSLENSKNDALWYPKILALAISTKDISKFEDGDPVPVSDMVARLYADGYDVDNSITYANSVLEKLRSTTFNILPTKILEIKKYSIDDKYSALLDRFIMDTLMTRVNDGTYIGDISLLDELTGLPITLSYKDAIVLLHYASLRANNTTYQRQVKTVNGDGEEEITFEYGNPLYPDKIPTKYEVQGIYKKAKDIKPLDDTIGYYGVEYKVKYYVNIDELASTIEHYDSVISSPKVLEKHVFNQFTKLINDIRKMRAQAGIIESKCWTHAYKEIMYHGMIDLDLSPCETYEEWIPTLPATVQQILKYYDTNKDVTSLYNKLSLAIISDMLPITTEVFGAYAVDTDATNKLYARLKQLFVQLCSYNILFLDTDRRQNDWAFLAKQGLAMNDIINYSIFFDDTTGKIINEFTDAVYTTIELYDMLLNASLSDIVIYLNTLLDTTLPTTLKDVVHATSEIDMDKTVFYKSKITSLLRNNFGTDAYIDL